MAASVAASGLALPVDATVADVVHALNGWSRTVDASLGLMSTAFSDLRGELVGTQNALVATVRDAKATLTGMHEGFRAALDGQGNAQGGNGAHCV